jgi:[protein-PII] uridylyltransferase
METVAARFENSRVGALRNAFREEKQALLEAFDAARPTARAAVRLLHDLARLVDRTLLRSGRTSARPRRGARRRRRLRARRALPAQRHRRAGAPAGGRNGRRGHPRRRHPVHRRLLGRRARDRLQRAHGGRLRRPRRRRRHGPDGAARVALLAGERGLFRAFQRARDAALDPRAFFRAKSLELQQRHQKFENTPYSLEPNVKESPGGLRDLQTVIWIARAAGLGRTWPNLACTASSPASR